MDGTHAGRARTPAVSPAHTQNTLRLLPKILPSLHCSCSKVRDFSPFSTLVMWAVPSTGDVGHKNITHTHSTRLAGSLGGRHGIDFAFGTRSDTPPSSVRALPALRQAVTSSPHGLFPGPALGTDLGRDRDGWPGEPTCLRDRQSPWGGRPQGCPGAQRLLCPTSGQPPKGKKHTVLVEQSGCNI